jgi:hypothetical protein
MTSWEDNQGLGAALASVEINVGNEMPIHIALKALSGFQAKDSPPLASMKRREIRKYGHLKRG